MRFRELKTSLEARYGRTTETQEKQRFVTLPTFYCRPLVRFGFYSDLFL